MQGTLGRNEPQFDFFDFFDMVLNSSATTTEKLIALVIGRHVGRNGRAAFPKRARVAELASCSTRNFERAIPVARTFFEVNQRQGRPTEYAPKGDITGEQIEAAIIALRSKTPRQIDGADETTDRQSVGRTTRHDVGIDTGTSRQFDGAAPRQSVGTPPDNLAGHKDVLKDPVKDKTPPTPSHVLPAGGTKRDPFGLNKAMTDIHRDVWFDADDRLQVANGFRAELEALVGTDRLRSELDRAAEWIGPNTPGTVLKAKVRGRLQSQAAERRDRDERYRKAVATREPLRAQQREDAANAALMADVEAIRRRGPARPAWEQIEDLEELQ